MRLAVLVVLAGCGGAVAEAPLTIPLGLPRAQADGALKQHAYCHAVDGPRPDVETYPRCKRAGAEWGESWVVATYDRDRLVELRRYERFSDPARATERWNQLVGEREKLTPSTADATRALAAKLLEPGTRSVRAFRVDAGTVVGIYLLDPHPPEDASILEVVLRT